MTFRGGHHDSSDFSVIFVGQGGLVLSMMFGVSFGAKPPDWDSDSEEVARGPASLLVIRRSEFGI
jgi:hypothetical protein